MQKLEQQGKTAMLVAIDEQLAGVVAVADTVKDEARQAVANLKDMGIAVWMMTGDNQRTARTIANAVGKIAVCAGGSFARR